MHHLSDEDVRMKTALRVGNELISLTKFSGLCIDCTPEYRPVEVGASRRGRRTCRGIFFGRNDRGATMRIEAAILIVVIIMVLAEIAYLSC